MKEQNNIVRVGLYGIPGAGKSTTCSIIEAYCIEKGYKFTRIKLADPLYKAQEAIYTMAGQKLGDFYEQDGELLNFLGYYFRKINPNSLLDRFAETLAEKIDELVLHNLPFSIIVCDDMRRPDAEFLRRNNFLVVKITAEAELCFQRRSKRGDKTLGSAHHSTEQGLDEIAPNYQIENNSTLEDLRTEVQTFIEGIKNDFDAQ